MSIFIAAITDFLSKVVAHLTDVLIAAYSKPDTAEEVKATDDDLKRVNRAVNDWRTSRPNIGG